MSTSMSLFIYFAIADYLRMLILYRIYSKSQKYVQMSLGKNIKQQQQNCYFLRTFNVVGVKDVPPQCHLLVQYRESRDRL